MVTRKYSVAQKVQLNVNSHRIFTIKEITDKAFAQYPYKLDDHLWYREDELIAYGDAPAEKKPLEIKTVFVVEGLQFDTKAEAEDHVVKVKLYEKFSTLFDPETLGVDKGELFDKLFDALVKDRAAYARILKG